MAAAFDRFIDKHGKLLAGNSNGQPQNNWPLSKAHAKNGGPKPHKKFAFGGEMQIRKGTVVVALWRRSGWPERASPGQNSSAAWR